MKKLFGSKEVVTPQSAIQKIDEMRDILEKKSTLVESQIQQDVESAKNHHRNKNKRAAIAALKKSKQREKQLVDGLTSELHGVRTSGWHEQPVYSPSFMVFLFLEWFCSLP